MKVVGDVKCYHCGHTSGQVEGTRGDRLVLHTFTPRPGYKGKVPGPNESIRCERCQGSVYLEDLRPAPAPLLSVALRDAKKGSTSSRNKAA